MDSEKLNYTNPDFKPSTIVELLRWRAKTQPNDRAYTFLKDGDKKDIKLTYSELDQRVRAVALSLQRKGLSGERALLLYPPGIDYIIGFFGCLYAGVIAVPAYPPDPNRLNRTLPRLQAIVNDAKATVALTNDSILYMIKMLKLGNKFAGSLDKLPFLRKFQTTMKYFSPSQSAVAGSTQLSDLQWISTDSVPKGMANDWSEPSINKDSISFLQYTSGSTGTPKGVILTHNNLMINSAHIYEGFGFSGNTEGVIWLPIYHDMGLIGGVLQPLYSGMPATLMSPIHFLQRPLRWLEAISKIKGRNVVSGGPNFAYDLCVKKVTPETIKKLDLSNWEVAFSGAEPVRPQTIERFSETFKEAGFRKESFMPCYGLAEATLFVTGCNITKEPVTRNIDQKSLEKSKITDVPIGAENSQIMVSCGHTPAGQKVAVVNPETFEECKYNEIGEIWIHGDNVSKGYWKRPKESKETFRAYIAKTNEGPFLRTGDLGFLQEEDNELFITGRLKDLIIIRGRNYYPQDVEYVVENSHLEIRPGCAAAFSIEEDNDEHLVIAAEVRHSKNINFTEIITDIRQAITETFDISPTSILLIRARTIPKTSSGKIQRHACKAEFFDDKLNIVHEWHVSKSFEVEAAEEAVTEIYEEAIVEAAEEVVAKEKSESVKVIEDWLVSHLADELGIKEREIDIKKPFSTYGLDSAQAIGMVGDIEVWLDRTLNPTIIWDYPNIEALALFLGGEGVVPAPALKKTTRKATDHEPIAIIGYSLRMPGAKNADEFWKNLRDGVDSISEVPPERWDVDEFYDPNPGAPAKMITRCGGFVNDVDKFDPQFFGISPREASHIDPQQRLLLEVSWEALEDAGQTWESVAGKPIGVYVGISGSDYSRLQSGDFNRLDAYSGTGNAFSIAANRISFVFDLKGPSFPVDTACSSSLVAVHNAIMSLRRGETNMALAGGVNMILAPDITISFSQARMMSPDGRCKTFDDSADGYVRGEGVGVVVLKRLNEAIRDGDHIHAVIRGSAVNQDGRSNGITAPNGLAQQEVIRLALADAGLSAKQISYFEAHGTGTTIGDPIEVNALINVMKEDRTEKQPLVLGSVKSNIGHLESAAGISGLLKTILTIEKETIPETLHFKKLNHLINLDNTHIEISTETRPWQRGETPRFAGVSAYGFGGANTHLILQEAPQLEKAIGERNIPEKLKAMVLPLSAHNPETLKAMAEAYIKFLTDVQFSSNEKLIDMLYSTCVRRSHHDERLAVVGSSREEFIEALQAFKNDEKLANSVSGMKEPNAESQIAFVFSGQGPQWYAMGRQLLETEPVYRETIETIDKLLSEYTDWKLMDELLADEENTKTAETEIAQPAIFALQVGLAKLWESWGVKPAAVIGHSVGEVTAAYISGTLSLEDAVKVIYHRSRLMQKATGFGKMASVELPIEELAKYIKGYENKLSLGAHNSPTNTVLSGEPDALEEVVKKLEKDDVFVRMLRVNYAFHSPHMDPYKEELIQCLEGIQINNPTTPVYSTVSGKLSAVEDYNPVYWSNNIRERVNFSNAVECMLKDGYTIFLELAPHPVLSASLSQCIRHHKKEGTVLNSLRRKEDERPMMLNALAALYTKGINIDWEKLLPVQGRYMPLPIYPWQRESYWFDLGGKGPMNAPLYRKPSAGQIGGHPLLGVRKNSPLNPGKKFWENEINTEYLPYLADHKVQESAVLPATAYLEMALTAANEANGSPAATLEDVSFFRAMFLPDDGGVKSQFILSPYTNGQAAFQVFTLSDDASGAKSNTWNLHSMGVIRNGKPESEVSEPAALNLDEIKKRCGKSIPTDTFFEKLHERGLQYGPNFQGVQELFSGENEAVARVELPESLQENAGEYQVHPALLDACFQVLSVALPADEMEEDGGDTYMPVAIRRMNIYKQPDNRLWSYASAGGLSSKGDYIMGNITVLDDGGQIVMEILDLKLQRLGQKKEENLSDWFYRLKWIEAEKEKSEIQAQPENNRGSWLIFTDKTGLGQNMEAQLNNINETVFIAQPGQSFKQIDDKNFELNPKSAEDFNQLMEVFKDSGQTPLKGILHLWSLDTAKTDQLNLSSLSDDQDLIIGSVLHITQTVLKSEFKRFPRLYLVTRGALSVVDEDSSTSITQTPLWGLGRVISVENPDLSCIKIDLNQNSEETEVEALLQEIWSEDRENQVAFRGGKRYALRMERARDHYEEDQGDSESVQQLLDVPEQPFELEITTPGVLGGLRYKPSQRITPEAGQVEIEVYATGLNFRDVLMALGLYPGGPIPLGSECSGVVTGIGEGVTELKPGDEVIGIAPKTFGKYVTTLANLIVPKPSNISFEDGATIPITYLTAYYAMHYIGRLQKGERALIHAGAGGVGQAAIQIAQMIGAEIFTTAGSEEKHEFLRNMGVKHIMSSRSLDFADDVMEATNGEGVDVVLNSLAGEFIPRSLTLLKPFGRFLEIGRTDIYQNSQIDMYPFRNNLLYSAIDLDMASREKPQLIRSLFLELMEYFKEEKLKPLPLTHFSASEAIGAFRYMAQRKNIGKIVVSMKEKSTREVQQIDETMPIRPDATYMITGGTGALGLLMAEWLINHGAKHLVLATFVPPSNYAKEQIDILKKQSAEIAIAMGDVTDKDQMSTIFSDISSNMPELKGIMHLAGLLDDKAIMHMNLESMIKVMRPKVEGSWNLHQLTLDHSLDFFIFFSSAASVVGSPGQANYTAANIFMDALSVYRKSIGLPSLTINWGFWLETGMAGKEAVKSDRTLFKGSRMIKPEQGLQILDRLIKKDINRTIVSPVVWSEVLDPYTKDRIPPLYLLFEDQKIEKAGKGAAKKASITGEQLAGMEAEERQDLMNSYLQNEIARVVGVSPSKLDINKPLNTMGLDSLMAIELKNSVESNLDASLPIAALLKGPPITELASDLIRQIMESGGDDEIDANIIVDESDYPLSYGQRALWFQHQLAPASIYNQIYAVRIPDKIDMPILRKSFDSLSRRHPSLRTNFIAKDGQPQQIVSDEIQTIFQDIDVSGKTEEEIHQVMREQIDRPFDLENEPLTRLSMLSKAGNDHIFLFIGHHIISDMWSLAIFMYELDQLYLAGGEAELPELGFTYSDYVRQQNKMLARAQGKAHLDYWQDKLKGDLPVINLPADYPRPPVQTYNGGTETLTINHEMAEKLKEIGGKNGSTLYTTLLAAFKVLLHRYTGQNDLIVGSPTTGRTSPEYAAILGYFVNPVAMRSTISGSETFESYLGQISETVIEALDHQDYPFNLLVEKLQPKRDPSRTPVFQLMFVYQKAYLLHESGMSGLAVAEDGGQMKLGGMTIESMSIENRVLPFDMTMLMAELDNGLGASLQYNTALFKRETVLRMLDHFHRLLKGIAEDPSRPISSYNLLADQEIKQVLYDWNQTQATYEDSLCVHQLFEAQVEKTPQVKAVVYKDASLTYDELNKKANQLARHLRKLDVGADVIVAIAAERSLEMFISVMAVLKAGAAYLPLDPSYPKERLAYMLEDSKAPLIITQKKLEAQLPQNNWRRIYLDDILPQVANESADNIQTETIKDNLAYVIYTSGSTGKPKGVMLTHSGLRNLVQAQIKEFGINRDTRLLQFASFSFDAAASEIFTTLLSGATLYEVNNETLLSGPDLIQFIEDNGITTSTLPPSVLRVLPAENLSSLKTIISAGESCSIDIAERWSKNRNLINAYGPTEGTICASCYHVKETPESSSVPIGVPIDNVQIYILDEYLNPVPVGIPGEFHIGGMGVARGYLNRPAITAEKFIPDAFSKTEGMRLYKTGDLARFLPDGNIEFLDRIDQQVKIRGFRIELGEIEHTIKLHETVKDAAVIAYGATDKRLAAYVISNLEGELNTEDLKYAARQRLPDYMIPSTFIKLDEFPLTANGKIDYKALPKPDVSRAEFVKAETETERKLAQIWQDVLNVEQVGINDNFFELGGHSLNIIQAQTKIKDEFDKEINVVEMFKYPTISSFSKFISGEQSGRGTKEQTQARASKQKKALDAQKQRMRSRRKK